MKLSDFDYELPADLIAQYPLKDRAACRLMVLDRANRSIALKTFDDITVYPGKNDLVVLNDTRVMPARLFGRRKTGGKVEIFLLGKDGPVHEALVRPSGRLKEGEKITLESGHEAEILGQGEVGRLVSFGAPVEDILKECGHVPLPPYINRLDTPEDREDYQTIYARREGATASPTAGLHFTKELLKRIGDRGAKIEYVTLHTSYGTFAPIKMTEVENHKMHREYFDLPAKTAAAVAETKERGGRVFAVGTTATRVLEHCALQTTDCRLKARDLRGYTDLYIFPGFQFKIVDHLITNFHIPKSTLMLLVSAFAGREFILEAYRRAIGEGFRFFSYGDAMLIL